MIGKLLSGIINLIISLVSTIFTPIDNLITSLLPGLSSAFTAIGNFIAICISGIGWVIDALGIPSSLIALIISYYTFKLTVPLLVHAVKLAIKWYDKLKP